MWHTLKSCVRSHPAWDTAGWWRAGEYNGGTSRGRCGRQEVCFFFKHSLNDSTPWQATAESINFPTHTHSSLVDTSRRGIRFALTPTADLSNSSQDKCSMEVTERYTCPFSFICSCSLQITTGYHVPCLFPNPPFFLSSSHLPPSVLPCPVVRET